MDERIAVLEAGLKTLKEAFVAHCAENSITEKDVQEIKGNLAMIKYLMMGATAALTANQLGLPALISKFIGGA